MEQAGQRGTFKMKSKRQRVDRLTDLGGLRRPSPNRCLGSWSPLKVPLEAALYSGRNFSRNGRSGAIRTGIEPRERNSQFQRDRSSRIATKYDSGTEEGFVQSII